MSNQFQQLFLPIEPLSEYNVSEILFDGQEVLEKPPNPSEHFQKIVNRIDFDEILDGNFDSKDNDDDNESKSKTIKSSSDNKVVIPFEKAKRSVLAGLTEVCAMIDILAVAKEKHYMVVEPVYSESVEHKNEVALSGKKSALAKASAILLSGSERFKKRVSELAEFCNTKRSYHNDLLYLRRRFRLKMFANGIVGDYSLRSIGSRYLEGGHFEVAENKDLETLTEPIIDLHSSRLILPVEEMFESYLTIQIMEEASQETLLNLVLQDPRTVTDDLISGPRLTPETSKQNGSRNVCNQNFSLLYEARRSLMMREIFYQLSQEVTHAFNQLNNQKPITLGVSVAQNNIVATLFPGIQVILKLIQCPKGCTSKMEFKPVIPEPDGVSSLISGLLHQLSVLYRYNQATQMSVENLWCDSVTFPPSVNSVRKHSGPLQLSNKQITELSNLTSQHNMLQTFLDHCRHYWLRQKVHECLSYFSKISCDPALVFHWNVTNSYKESSVVVTLVTCGYEDIKTRINISVLTQSLIVYLPDNNTHISLSYDLTELKRIIQYQITCHHLTTFRRVLHRSMWQCLSSNLNSGIGTSHEYGTNPAVLLYASPTHQKILCVRGGNQAEKIQLFLKDTNSLEYSEELKQTSVLLNRNWDCKKHKFKEVNLTKIRERCLVARLESILNIFTEL